MIARGREIHSKKTFSVFFLAIIITFCVKANNPLTAESILSQTFQVNKSIHKISLTILLKERVDGDFIRKKSDFKIDYKPYKVYLKQRYPNVGMEVLYNEKVLKDKAIVNRNSRAFSSIKLDPAGNLMRKGNHHSIFKAGFFYLVNVLEHLGNKYPLASSSKWIYKGLVRYDGILCYKIEFNNPEFRFIDYTIKEGENLETLTRRDKISDFMIFEKNQHIKSFDNIKPGTKIKIPNDYAKHIIVYIDKIRLVPIGMKASDSEDLFEEYTYRNIDMNPKFTEIDFNHHNPAYNF